MSVSLEAHASRPAPGALRALANRRGTALAEYGLLLGLFLAVVVALVTGMGSHLRSIFSKANTELHSGDCAATGNCSVASAPSGSGGSGGSGTSSGGGSSPSDGGASGSGWASSGGGGTPTPPNEPAADQPGGSSGAGGGGSEPPPTLDIYPR